ncbi:MAG: hypothetical protein RLZZ488_1842 [Pseudomonadota bacterium]|jgi:hypothetical protein
MQRKNALVFASAFSLFAVACGKKLENSALPKPASEITPEDFADPVVRDANQRWSDLAAELKIPTDGSNQSLYTASGFFDSTSEGSAAYKSLTEKLAAEHLKTAAATDCAGVDSFDELGSAKAIKLPDIFPTEIKTAKWYLMKYRRRAADGNADPLVYGALVSVPTESGKTFPVVAYSHAGDRGLSALEVAAIFGDLQSKHIVVAPAFPGEPICKFGTSGSDKTGCDAQGRYFDAVGVSAPYSTDAEDLLAAHNCVVTANALPNFNTTVTQKIKTQTPAGLSVGSVPVSYMAGSSRGGMAALIALAKNSAMLEANLRTGSQVYSQPKYFNCLATNINPTNFTYGEFRAFLAAIVKGTAKSMEAYTLPTAPQLDALMDEYRNGTINAQQAALKLQLRDATFNARLSLASVRNWATGGKGSMVTMHGTLDVRIPISQGQFGGRIFSSVNQNLIEEQQNNLSLPAGVQLTSLGTIAQPPYSVDGGKTLLKPNTMHGDFAWFNSLVGVSTSATNADGTPKALAADNLFLNQKPIEAFSYWLETDPAGCASATAN